MQVLAPSSAVVTVREPDRAVGVEGTTVEDARGTMPQLQDVAAFRVRRHCKGWGVPNNDRAASASESRHARRRAWTRCP